MNSRQRKNKTLPSRGGRNRPNDRPTEGLYTNNKVVRALGSLVGLNAQVTDVNKQLQEGVFTSFSPNFQVVVNAPHSATSNNDPSIVQPGTIPFEKVIYPSESIVWLKIQSVDFDFGTKGFQTDETIAASKATLVQSKEKELEPWNEGEESTTGELGCLEGDTPNGWDPKDMFKTNEQNHGITSTYRSDMQGYTTPMPSAGTKNYVEMEAMAQKIAQEIQNHPRTSSRAELENGDDEEERFSAVFREGRGEQHGGKYMPPQRRKIQGGNVKQPNRVHSSQGTGTRYSTSPPKGSYQAGTATTSALNPSVGVSSSSQKHPAHPQSQRHGPNQGPHHSHSTYENKTNGETRDLRRAEAQTDQRREAPHSKGDHHNEYSHGPPTSKLSGTQSMGKHQEPKEQRKRDSKEDNTIASLKQFGNNFKLSSDNKPTPARSNQELQYPPANPSAVAASQQEDVNSSVASASNAKPIVSSVDKSADKTSGTASNKDSSDTASKVETANASDTSQSLNPDAEVFIPRFAPNTPPQVHTTPVPMHPHHPQQMHAVAPPLAYPPNMIPGAAYVVPPQHAMQQTNRYPKRVQMQMSQPRQEFATQIQVANATGPPLMSQPTVPPQTMPVPMSVPMHHPMAQNPYPHYQMLMRFAPGAGGVAMMQAPLVSSAGAMYHPNEMQQAPQNHGHQGPMFYSGMGMPQHSPQVHTSHPPQPPTPQGHSGGGQGPLTMPTQPPTPVPTPTSVMYSGAPVPSAMAGQPTIPQHLGQPNPHQQQHGQYLQSGHQTPLYMLPQQPHMSMAMPPPHGGVHVPSSVPGYSNPSSGLVAPLNHQHVHYIHNAGQGHNMPGSLQHNNH